jgi:MerR family transcriptional regulator, light-induced transcriptional regulator
MGRETIMSNRSAADSQRRHDDDADWSVALNELGKDKDTVTLNQAQIMDLLSHVVEGEIIPRLMMAHQNFAAPRSDLYIRDALSADAIEHFAKLTISGEVDDLENHIIALGRQGIATESVYLDLLAPAARKLGQYWEEDVCSFTDVTVGLGRLQTILFRLSAKHTGVADPEALITKGLFVTPLGAQHSFGIRMVEDLFARAGWQTVCLPSVSSQDLVQAVQSEAFDLVGIGISIEDQIDVAQEMVNVVRENSLNPQIKIMVGGNMIVAQPDLAAQLHADLSAKDAREAVTIAQNIIYDQRMRH